ncbi:MAG: 4-alpha-glucanotransferase [Bacteroidaceae bacterium]|nr:4-alpha-glucanotransferase [Bacteroidaceae bacterium]
MKLHFSIEYITRMGEDIRLQCDGWEKPLTTTDGRTWTLCLDWNASQAQLLTYRYAMYREGSLVWTEWEMKPHTLWLTPDVHDYVITDSWRPIPDDLPLYSSAYTDPLGLTAPVDHAVALASIALSHPVSIQLRTTFPRLCPGERIALMSSLNGWTEPYPMLHLGKHEWAISFPADVAEYKFVILNDSGIVEWESGGNRRLSEVPVSASRPTLAVIESVLPPRIKRPEWRVAGVVIPVFSLRTKRSQGVGDFADLLDMVRWAASVGMRAVQVLPVNDTTATGTFADSYPYNAISCFALHPMYCDLTQLGYLNDSDTQQELQTEWRVLNALSQVDYVAVNRLKSTFLRRMYEQEGARVMRTKAYRQFVGEMRQWLVPYAVFCHLRDKNATCVFSQWREHSKYNKEAIDALFDGKEKRDIHFYAYVQFLLHRQLTAVRDEAARLGVMLKGDIPIGVSRDSVEVWTDPSLFNVGVSAGAPPDAFAADGQNWGFPTYNWDMMAKDGYQWWRRRLHHLSLYFNAYRIDHVLGFFRIWQIPTDAKSGLLGQFAPSIPLYPDDFARYGFRFEVERTTWPYQKNIDRTLFVRDQKDIKLVHPRIGALTSTAYAELPDDQRRAYEALYNDYFYRRHNQFWRDMAMSKLPSLVQSTNMLVCAEDLGMVPACVPSVMDDLRILSLEIQSMPKQQGLDFGVLDSNPVRSVATISTHDMPTMRGWWRHEHDQAQKYWRQVLHHGGEAPRELTSWLADDIIWRHLASPSMLCLLSLQDWLSSDESLRHPDPDAERINIPAIPRHYWRYRMHITIGQLAQSHTFCDHLRKIIKASGR